MSNKYWTYEADIALANRKYNEVIDAARASCTQFILVCRSRAATEESFGLSLGEFLIASSRKADWPGTKLLVGDALVGEFVLNDESAAVLKTQARSFFDWLDPALPEDLSFVRENGLPWLTTTSHERDLYFSLGESEAANLRARIPGIVRTPLIGIGASEVKHADELLELENEDRNLIFSLVDSALDDDFPPVEAIAIARSVHQDLNDEQLVVLLAKSVASLVNAHALILRDCQNDIELEFDDPRVGALVGNVSFWISHGWETDEPAYLFSSGSQSTAVRDALYGK